MPDELKEIKNLLVKSVKDACNTAFENLLDEEVNLAMDECLYEVMDRVIKAEFNLEVWLQRERGKPNRLNIEGSWWGCDSLLKMPLKRAIAHYVGLQLGWVKDEEKSSKNNCLEAISVALADFEHINHELIYLMGLVRKNIKRLEDKKKVLDKGGAI